MGHHAIRFGHFRRQCNHGNRRRFSAGATSSAVFIGKSSLSTARTSGNSDRPDVTADDPAPLDLNICSTGGHALVEREEKAKFSLVTYVGTAPSCLSPSIYQPSKFNSANLIQ